MNTELLFLLIWLVLNSIEWTLHRIRHFVYTGCKQQYIKIKI